MSNKFSFKAEGLRNTIIFSNRGPVARITPEGVMQFTVDANDENAKRFIECIDAMLTQMGRCELQSLSVGFHNSKGGVVNAIEFLKRTDGHRVVSTGDLYDYQIAKARRDGKMFVDEDTGLGWVLLPWELTTEKDRERERKYFESNLPQVVVANDVEGDQAIYVNGLLKGSDSTIYACDIIENTKESAFFMKQINVDWFGDVWPENLSALSPIPKKE